jgi:hypothetical protein
VAEFETKDSGARAQFDSGMQRDTEEGKARFDLLIPDGVPYEAQLLTRFAELMGRGAIKYEDRNWEKADSDAEIRRAKSSAFRHFMQWFCGETDEDHAVATMFNIMVVETTKPKVEAREEWVDPHPRNESDLAAESVEAEGISVASWTWADPHIVDHCNGADRSWEMRQAGDPDPVIDEAPIPLHAIDEKARRYAEVEADAARLRRVAAELNGTTIPTENLSGLY